MVQSRVLYGEKVSESVELKLWKWKGRLARSRGRRTEVQEIDLSYKGFFRVKPLDLDGFCSLCKLDLSHSILYELPESIGSLLSLTHLFLNDNYLSSLQPIIIGRLVNLQELDLRNNKLNNFSLDITELSCLRRLSVQGNPLNDDETRKLMKLAHNERWIDIAGECKIL